MQLRQRKALIIQSLSMDNSKKLTSSDALLLCCSILGMHIFGCKFSLKTETGDTVPDRKNFDSLLWAIVTVFQVISISLF